MKVLLSAYACCPGMGSEPGVGWNWARRLARKHDVWVLTSSVHAAKIAAWHERPPVNWVFVRPPLRPSRRPLINWIRHYLWQVLAFRKARELHRKVGFDLAHHVTFASWRLPSLLWRLGIPLVWGPIGGGQDIPPGFASLLGRAGRVREAVRGISQRLSRYDPLVRQTLRHARTVIAANLPTERLLADMGRHDVERFLETAIEPPATGTRGARVTGDTLRLLWVGGLIPRKALPLLLHALARVAPAVSWRLEVVGEGGELRRWSRMARSLALQDRVSFLGRLPRSEVLQRYEAADVLVFSSIRDTSGNVLLEAMSAGLPIVALAWSGTPEILTDECAILVAPTSLDRSVADLAAAIESLAGSVELRQRLGAAGRQRVAERFSWDVLAARMAVVYREAVAGGLAAATGDPPSAPAGDALGRAAATSAPSSGATRKSMISGEVTPHTR